jgi:membrane protein implicated in regulation of membrane protease activity
MDWSASTWWWVATGVLVAAELATGTFYLLMLAVGTLAAAIAAHTGATFATQLIVAAVVGGGTTLAWHVLRGRGPKPPATSANRDINLDVGEHVSVTHWHADGHTEVTYRGATWRARWAGQGAPQPGRHVIRAVEGSQLLLDAAA